MNVLVTGARGFIGRNLIAHLGECEGIDLALFDSDNSTSDLRAKLKTADIVYHLAGVNRPRVPSEFEAVNAGLTRELCKILRELKRAPVIVMSSSVQADLDSPYGVSKRQAENALLEFAAETGATVNIYRLKNVFGKWCRPNYNSVVATFCHNIANDLPIQISDPQHELELAYVDDVVNAFLSELPSRAVSKNPRDIPSFRLTLGDLAGRIQCFNEMRLNLLAPDFGVRFNQQLYATYLSYIPHEKHRLQLEIKSDDRGELAEFMKSDHFGQIFISRTRPGITRGNHYHHTKTEKFFVVQGEGIVRMRQIESSQVFEYRVRGGDFQVIDIPPGYAHSIENVGADEMVTLFWASEVFCPDNMDTYFLPVFADAQREVAVTE
jgi:UDP-2-acetamido-2,6-beta-L-arabino-hexul-4-ose reductase